MEKIERTRYYITYDSGGWATDFHEYLPSDDHIVVDIMGKMNFIPGRYRIEDGKLVDTFANRERLEQLRAMRPRLLKSFDIYKSNVIYGIIEEAEEDTAAMKEWYKAVLDLNDEAIIHPPFLIQHYAE